MKFVITTFCLLLVGQINCQTFYFRAQPPFLDGDIQQINILFQSTDQMVWIGTDRGLYSFDGRKYIHYPRPDGRFQKVSAISESQNKRIWVGYEDGYIHSLNLSGINEEIPVDSISQATISKIVFHQNGEVYIATYGKGIWLWNQNKCTRLRYDLLDGIDDVYDALIDSKDRIWLATDNGIIIYENRSTPVITHIDRARGLPDEIVTQLELQSDGNVSIGLYDRGLARYYANSDTVHSLLQLQTKSGNVTGLVNGRNDNIWMVTERNLIKYTNPNAHQIIMLPDEIKDRIQSILFDKSGNLWIASGNKLFITNTQIEYIMPGVNGIQAVAATGGKLWLGCESGLYSIKPASPEVSSHLENEKINILSMYADPDGLLWIGTFGQGLYIYDPIKNKLRHLTEKDQISNNSILNIDGLNHTVWLASLGGITEIKWKNNALTDKPDIIQFQDKFNFPTGYVYDVFVAGNGVVWFGTDGKGLFYLEQDQLKPFIFRNKETSQQLLDIKTIYSVATDHQQNIWIAGSKGKILQLDPSGNLLFSMSSGHGSLNTLITTGEGEMIVIQEGMLQIRDPGGEMYVYSETAGLKAFAPNINASAMERDGSVWIADTDRVLHYTSFPQDTDRYVHMHLEAIKPGSLDPAKAIKMKPDSNYLDVRFTGLWYQDPASVRYRYKLEGHDQDWIYTREGRAVYSRLSPGTYTFIVEGSHNDDFSGSRPIRKGITVLPPLYIRWWFILGISMFISGLVFSYILSRIKRIKKMHQLEKEKTMLQLHAIQAQVNPHFLFNSFNTLSSIIEEDQKAAVDYVDQLSDFFRGVLMYRNAEWIRLDEELEIVRNYTYILQKRYGENLRIAETINHTMGWIAPLSIQLLVENAIKHNTVSKDKPLTISITVDRNWVIVSNPIQTKIEPSTESTGFGLSSLIARYQYLKKDKIEITHEQNTFTVKIPIIHTDKPV